MLYINKVTDDPQQQLTLTGIPNVTIQMYLRYLPRMNGWMANFDDGTTTINGILLVTSLNLLRQFKNNIQYGISCITASGLDPYNIGDFATQAANLYLLDSADVQTLESGYFQ